VGAARSPAPELLQAACRLRTEALKQLLNMFGVGQSEWTQWGRQGEWAQWGGQGEWAGRVGRVGKVSSRAQGPGGIYPLCGTAPAALV